MAAGKKVVRPFFSAGGSKVDERAEWRKGHERVVRINVRGYLVVERKRVVSVVS